MLKDIEYEICDQCKKKLVYDFMGDNLCHNCMGVKNKCSVEALHKHYSNQYGYDFCPRCGISLGGLENEM